MAARASIVVEMSGDEAKLLRSMQRVLDKERERDQASERAGRNEERRGRRFQESARRSIAGLNNMIRGYVGLQTIINATTASIERQRQIAQQSAREQRQEVSGAAQLAEISPTRARFEDLRQASRRFLGRSQIGDLDRAQLAVRAMADAGVLQDQDLLADMRRTRFTTDVAGTARAIGQARVAIPGIGGTRDIVNRSMAAAAFTPSNFTEVIAGSARAGANARLLGLGAEDVLASVAALSPEQGQAEIAGTRVQALLGGLIRRNVQGGSLQEMLSNVQGMGLDNAGLQRFLGSQEALVAFSGLTQGESARTFAQARAEVAANRDIIGQRMSFVERDPELRAALAAEGREQDIMQDPKVRRRGRAVQEFNAWLDAMGEDEPWGRRFFGNLFGEENYMRFHRSVGGELPTSAEAFLEDAGSNLSLSGIGANLGEAAADLRGSAADLRGATNGTAGLRGEAAMPQE